MPENPKPPCLIRSIFSFTLQELFVVLLSALSISDVTRRGGGGRQRSARGRVVRRTRRWRKILVHLLSISPASIASLIALGLLPSTWQPTEKAVPRTSLTVPSRLLEKDLKRIVLAISMISSRATDLLCLMFFSFLRSRGGSFRARMTREEAEGTTETAA